MPKKILEKQKTSDLLKKFGDKVRIERLKKRWSQEDLAHKCGLHRTYIGIIERAEKSVTLSTVEKIAKALDTTILELLTF